MADHLHWTQNGRHDGTAFLAAPEAERVVDARRCTIQMSNGFLYLDVIAGPATALLGHDDPPEIADNPSDFPGLLARLAPGFRCLAVAADFDAARRLARGIAARLAGGGGEIEMVDACRDEPRTARRIIVAEENLSLGRAGTWLASALWPRPPDLVVIGEAIAGGEPFGAVLVAERLAPPGAAIARDATVVLSPATARRIAGIVRSVEAEGLIEQATRLGAYLRQRLQSVRAACPQIASLHGGPLSPALEFVPPLTARQVKRKLCERGVLAGEDEAGRLLIVPSLTLRFAEIDVVSGTLRSALLGTPTWRPSQCCSACQAEEDAADDHDRHFQDC